jgi:hypothetical protein
LSAPRVWEEPLWLMKENPKTGCEHATGLDESSPIPCLSPSRTLASEAWSRNSMWEQAPRNPNRWTVPHQMPPHHNLMMQLRNLHKSRCPVALVVCSSVLEKKKSKIGVAHYGSRR